jgi:fatty acid desaturase
MMTALKSYALIGDAGRANSLTNDTFEDDVSGQWFAAKVDRKVMKSLMKREDGPALRHFGVWLVLLLGSGAAVIWTWGTWAALPWALFYGVMYSMSDHHAHELSHGTPFKTKWVNELLYQINGFMTLHEGEYWRWSHTRHHTDTLLVGRDPEIAVMAPPNIIKGVLDFFFLWSGTLLILSIVKHAFGSLSGDGEHFIPDTERRKVVRTARVYLAIMVATVALAVFLGSWLPIVLVVAPRFYGGFMAQLFNITQHAGLKEDVLDHRQNCRTFYTNPVFRFLYMNMNYHVEHHMFPMIPFFRLPEMHEAMKSQCPPPYPSVVACWVELVPAVWKQRRNPGYFVARPLPEGVAAFQPAE